MRIKSLSWTGTYVIKLFVPFNWPSKPDLRKSLLIAANGKDEDTYPIAHLHPENVKHYIVEIYDSIKTVVCNGLNKYVKTTCLPSLCAHFDKWVSKISKGSYLGFRVSYYTKEWVYETFNMAIKPFDQSTPDLEIQASEIMGVHFEQCLEEFGLNTDHVFVCVTDSGADVSHFFHRFLW